jgi:hypothetical protein
MDSNYTTSSVLDLDQLKPTRHFSPNIFHEGTPTFFYEYAKGGSWCKSSIKYLDSNKEGKKEDKLTPEEKANEERQHKLVDLKINMSILSASIGPTFNELTNKSGDPININSPGQVRDAIEKLSGIKINNSSKKVLKKLHLKSPELAEVFKNIIKYRAMKFEYFRLEREPLVVEGCSKQDATATRSAIGKFSSKSKRNILNKLCAIDQNRLKVKPQLATLTFQNFNTNHQEIYLAFDRWRRRLRYEYPEVSLLWRFEFSTSKIPRPHYHLLIVNGDLCKNKKLKEWLSKSWHHSCYRTEVDRSDNAKHLGAGTSIEYVKSWDKVSRYTSKYIVKDDPTPDWWSNRRYWGIINQKVFNELTSIIRLELTKEEHEEVQEELYRNDNEKIIKSAKLSKSMIVDCDYLAPREVEKTPKVIRDFYYRNSDNEKVHLVRSCYDNDLKHLGYLVSNFAEFKLESYKLVCDKGNVINDAVDPKDLRFLKKPTSEYGATRTSVFFDGEALGERVAGGTSNQEDRPCASTGGLVLSSITGEKNILNK